MELRVQFEFKQEGYAAIYSINCQFSKLPVPTSPPALPVSRPESYQLTHLTNPITPRDVTVLRAGGGSGRSRGCSRRVPSGAESNYLKRSSPLFIRLSGCEWDSFPLFWLVYNPEFTFFHVTKQGNSFGFSQNWEADAEQTAEGTSPLACTALQSSAPD